MSTAQPTPPTIPPPRPATTAHRRTHPITPLVTGWKIVVGVIAVITAQNIARLIEDFTITRALIGAGLLVAAVIIAVVFSFLSWLFMTYAVDDEGVSIRKGVISKSREFAPRARIESVSVERPLLARLLGLAKVRIEVAGGGESYLDIEYIKAAHAEQLRVAILQVVALERRDPDGASREGEEQVAGAAPPPAGSLGAGHAEAQVTGTEDEGPHVRGAREPADEQSQAPPTRGPLHELLPDGLTEGEPIAEIPTGRLVRSLLRDADFVIGSVAGLLGVAVAIGVSIWQEGVSIPVLVALVPAFIAIPKYVLGRIEAGWGFVSRLTDRGLRMRRGLLNTRTDNIATGRIQRFHLKRPLLWRGPGWTAVTVTVAGIDDSGENGAENALPVGTREELALTIGHLAAPLGTSDDLAALERLLTTRARDIDGVHAPHPLFWVSRRTRVTVLLPGALIHRSGILARQLEIIPRDRIQALTVEDGPLSRRLGVLDLKVGVAGHTATLSALPRTAAFELESVLARDAATLRRYRERDSWPQPALAAGAGR